jgi:DNA-binding SARP family transcriptional activator
VALSEAQSRLLVALAVAHPAPLHVERATDVLWPGAGLDVTRDRLNSLVHRLRRALGDHGAAVTRTGDLLRLDPGRCAVDLWAFRRALAGPPGERAAALRGVGGNLCEAQFPYDDHLIAERHRLAGDWLRHARAAVAGGEARAPELEPALDALGLDADLL